MSTIFRLTPLSVRASVVYTNISAATQTGQTAKLALRLTGGAPPFSYSVSNGMQMISTSAQPQVAVGTMPAPSSNLSLSVTVSDSSPSPQTVTQQVIVNAPSALPIQYLHIAILDRVNAFNAFVTQLQSEGHDTSTIINPFTSPAPPNGTGAGLTTGQYQALLALAANYRSDLTTASTSYNGLRAQYSLQGQSVPASAMQSKLQTQWQLPGTYSSRLASAFVGTSLDNFGWQYASNSLEYCLAYADEEDHWGCDAYGGYDPGPAWDLFYMHDASLDLSPTGALHGWSQDYIWGYVYYGSFTWSIDDPVLDVDITDPLGISVVDQNQTVKTDCGAGCTQVEVWGQANEAGYYALTSTASDPNGVTIAGNDYSYIVDDQIVLATLWNPYCGPPTINSLQVENKYGQLQPTNAVQVGGSGYFLIQAACFDSSTQVAVDGSGVQIIQLFGIGGPTLYVQYSVDSNAPVGPQNLWLATDAGSTSTPIAVVQNGPYITAIRPNQWGAGSVALPVQIIGAGFGSTAPAISYPVQTSSGSVMFSITSWSDALIQGTVTVASSDPGESVTVTVTAGPYGIGFAPNPQQNQSALVQATVTPPGQPNLTLTLNSNPVPPYSNVFIFPQPSFPPLMASLASSNGQSLSGNVTWSFSSTYSSPPYKQNPPIPYPCNGSPITQPASAPFNVANSLAGICGGASTISYIYGIYNGSITFNVLGSQGIVPSSRAPNPSVSAIQSLLSSFPWSPSQPWYLFKLVNHENSYYQFNPPGVNEFLPDWGPPQGFGIMQLDPPDSVYELWDWTKNVLAGAQHLQTRDINWAITFWDAQISNWIKYNAGGYNEYNGVPNPPSPPLFPPPDSVQGSCTFSYIPLGANDYSLSDALAMKAYNTGTASPFVKFVPPSSDTTYNATWNYSVLGGNGTDYVSLVCNTPPQ